MIILEEYEIHLYSEEGLDDFKYVHQITSDPILEGQEFDDLVSAYMFLRNTLYETKSYWTHACIIAEFVDEIENWNINELYEKGKGFLPKDIRKQYKDIFGI
jgi:hypothetical protein